MPRRINAITQRHERRREPCQDVTYEEVEKVVRLGDGTELVARVKVIRLVEQPRTPLGARSETYVRWWHGSDGGLVRRRSLT